MLDVGGQWRVAPLASCLGHVGMETYVGSCKQGRLSIIVDGEVR